jgi:SpoU rRNA methylase family enzyme
VPFLESAAFAAVLTQASSWAQRASGQAADDGAKFAAQLLYSSGVAVAALRTLDNGFRRVVGAVSQLDVNWPDERRQAAVESILEIAHSDVVLPELQDAVGYLRGEVPNLDEPEHAYALRILEAGQDVVDFMSKAPGHTPFETKEQLTTLLNGIAHADTSAWVERTVELCEEALYRFDRGGLGELTVTLGELKATLVRKHPSIAPAPRWTLAAATAPLAAE